MMNIKVVKDSNWNGKIMVYTTITNVVKGDLCQYALGPGMHAELVVNDETFIKHFEHVITKSEEFFNSPI